ncbi:MAG: hypothetical protein LBP22_11290, partial [Deltaproteobacteria bacterium]|nr:hypothetical protein [Deltaproteobacteria bacterium]
MRLGGGQKKPLQLLSEVLISLQDSFFEEGIMDLTGLRIHFANIWPHLNERQRRLFAASEAQALGYG